VISNVANTSSLFNFSTTWRGCIVRALLHACPTPVAQLNC
jgi:hypothetical protein